jgi:tight adherence protein C
MLGLIIAVALTSFLGVALIVLLLGGRSAVGSRLSEVATVGTAVEDSTAPGGSTQVVGKVLGFVAPIRKMLGMTADADVTRRLGLAGFREPYHTDVFYASKLLLPVVGAGFAAFFIKDSTIFWFFALGSLGFFGPELWLGRAITKRREQIRFSLPDALDLLVICMEAGLGMDQALIRVGQELRISHPELSEEFLLINLEQRAGKPRVDAWRNMADRTGLEVVRAFVNMLVQTERFGTPISRSLGNFADALRLKRRQQAEEQAAKTTIKMIFPLVIFIFPSMFIVLLGPAIIAISKTMKHVFGG